MTIPSRLRRDPTCALPLDQLDKLVAAASLPQPNRDEATIAYTIREMALEILALRGERDAALAVVRHVAARIRCDGDFGHIAGAATETLALTCKALATVEPRDADEIQDRLLDRTGANVSPRRFFSEQEIHAGLQNALREDDGDPRLRLSTLAGDYQVDPLEELAAMAFEAAADGDDPEDDE